MLYLYTRNGDILLDKQIASCIEEEDVLDLTLRKVYDFAMTTPLDDIRFILDTARLNKTAAERSSKVNMVMDWVKSYVALRTPDYGRQCLLSYPFLHFGSM